MVSSDNNMERRKHERFQMDGGIFALFLSSTTKFGRIKEVSLSGLTIRHFDGEEWETITSESDILLNGSNICVNKVPVKIILDHEITTEGHFKPLSERQCIVQFGKLSDLHISQLEYFIENYAKNDIHRHYSFQSTLLQNLQI